MKHALWLLPALVFLAACGSDPAPSGPTTKPHTDPSFFFAGDLPEYAQQLGSTARSQLAVLRAIRRVDPCALVPKDALTAQPALVAAVPGDALNSCQLSFEGDGPTDRLDVSIVPTASRSSGEEYFEVDGQPVYQGRSGDLAICPFFFESGLDKLPGAPRDVSDAQILVRAYRHDKPCDLAKRVATEVVKAKAAGVPHRDDTAKILDADPCGALVASDKEIQLDLADSTAYHCEGLTQAAGDPLGRTVWVDFHRLPAGLIEKLQSSQQDGIQVWADPTAKPFAELLASSPAPAAKSSSFAKPSPPRSSTTKAKPPSGPHCIAYATAPDSGAAPSPPQLPSPSGPVLTAYVTVGGQIDCQPAKNLAASTAKGLTS